MKKDKLNYRFHNPNSDSQTASYILKIFLEADCNKSEQAIQQAGLDAWAEAESKDEAITMAM